MWRAPRSKDSSFRKEDKRNGAVMTFGKVLVYKTNGRQDGNLGKQEGRKEGRKRGRKEGREEGREEGRKGISLRNRKIFAKNTFRQTTKLIFLCRWRKRKEGEVRKEEGEELSQRKMKNSQGERYVIDAGVQSHFPFGYIGKNEKKEKKKKVSQC